MSMHETWQDENIDGINTMPWALDWFKEWTIDFVYENLIILRMCYYDKFKYGFHVWKLLILFFLVDVGMVIVSNPTHIWSKWVIHNYHIDEGVVWKRQFHSLLALQPWPELKVNDYLIPEKFMMPWGKTETIAHEDFWGARNKGDYLFLSNPLVSHKVDKYIIDAQRETTSKLSQNGDWN